MQTWQMHWKPHRCEGFAIITEFYSIAEFRTRPTAADLILKAGSGILAVSAAWTFWRWLDWRCDLWAVTSQRVID